VINKNHRTLYILEFKQSSDRYEDFLRHTAQRFEGVAEYVSAT